MLIVCPNCATSYMIEPASLGPAGRTVRCARCKTTWFAGGPHHSDSLSADTEFEIQSGPQVNTFVNGVIAEAEANAAGSRATQGSNEYDGTGEHFGDEADENAGAIGEAGAEPQQPASEPFAAKRADEYQAPDVIEDAPSLVPPIEQEIPDVMLDAHEPEEPEDFAARRIRMQARRKQARRSSRWTAVLLVLFAFNVALVGARNEVVRYLPQTAPLFSAIGLPVNLRHLDFKNVRISREKVDGAAILVVQGSIVSTAKEPVEVPRLRFAARNKEGQEIYTWTMRPERKVLKPGDRLEFQSRLATPPKDAHDVMVRFFTANDAMAGSR